MNQYQMPAIKKSHLLMAVAFLMSFVVSQLITSNAFASGTFTQVLVRFDRIQKSTATTGTVCANPTTTDTEATVKVTFPASYTLGAAGTFTVSTTNLAWPSGGTAWPSIATASSVTGQVVTFTSGDLTVGTLYCFNWTNSAAVTTQSSAASTNTGTVETYNGSSALVDSAAYITPTLNADQIAVTASVPQAFSFALSGTTDALGSLSSGSVTSSPTPRTVTIDTNAKNGWQVWAKDLNSGLKSATAGNHVIPSYTPGTNHTITTAAENYNTGVTSGQTSGPGTITIDTAFVGGSSGKGGGLDSSLRSLATSNGTAQAAVLTLTNNATIIGTTPAATDYTDTITVTGAGLF
jgi:hypothetical protein